MTKPKRVFIKCFNITKDNNPISKIEFDNLLKEMDKAEAFSTHYDSFRSIIRTVKKASHKAGLVADIAYPATKHQNNRKITLLANPNESISINVYLLLVPLSNLTSEDHFGITSFIGSKEYIELYNEFDSNITRSISIPSTALTFEDDYTDIDYIE